ncbi:MAG TPA: hypothetical protein VLA87_14250 [Gaiellaceae bacterium]|nr:hypothetical protein [Gaiellaceae bacterium]
MATRRTVRRLVIVAALAVATIVALMVFLTWGAGTGGTRVG